MRTAPGVLFFDGSVEVTLGVAKHNTNEAAITVAIEARLAERRMFAHELLDFLPCEFEISVSNVRA